MKKAYFFTVVFCFGGLLAMVVQSCGGNDKKEKVPTDNGSALVFKEKLSDYGFFAGKLSELKPQPNVIPYELATPLFTDYALKDRFIVVPKGKQIKYMEKGSLDFPDSTFIIKNFAYTNTANQKVMIETRILARDPADHKWKVMNYLWNKEQTDAVKHIVGAKLPITLLDDAGQAISTTYLVPNTNDCKRCHINSNVFTPIGPKARNVNFTPASKTENQLAHWATVGILTGLPDLATVERLPDYKDSKQFSLEQRARAYLDVNCAHCHTQGGDAYNTGLFLEYEQKDPQHLGVMKEPVSAGAGAGGLNFDVVPGDARHSIVAYRMNSNEPGTAMPELARTVVHKEGVQLISDWINSMGKKAR